MPGWGKDSYGLLSDDGHYYHQLPLGAQFCEPWHVGDTCKYLYVIILQLNKLIYCLQLVGLGVNYATKEIFVTRNGTLLGTMGSKIRNLMHMYPTVGIKRVDNKCRVNFGQRPFEFDIMNYLQKIDKDDNIKSKWPFKLYSQVSKCINSNMQY